MISITDEFVNEVHKKVRDRMDSVGHNVSSLSNTARIALLVFWALGIYLISQQTGEKNNTLAIIVGLAIVTFIILKIKSSTPLSDFELRTCLIYQLLRLQQHPMGDFPAIPTSAEIWVSLLCVARQGMANVPLKEFQVKWKDKYVGESFEGCASVSVDTGNMVSVLPQPLGYDPRERKQIKYVASEDLRKMGMVKRLMKGGSM